jgi:hypothetical protein
MAQASAIMTELTIYPTHTCFDDALEYCELIAKREGKQSLQQLTLVHAIVLHPEGPRAGQPYAHAWIEEGDEAIFAGILNGEKVYCVVDRIEYAERLRVQHAWRYTMREAHMMNKQHGTYGPWEKRLLVLARGASQG